MTREEAIAKLRLFADVAVSHLGAPPMDDESGLIMLAAMIQEVMYECYCNDPELSEQLPDIDRAWKEIWNALGFVTADQLDPPDERQALTPLKRNGPRAVTRGPGGKIRCRVLLHQPPPAAAGHVRNTSSGHVRSASASSQPSPGRPCAGNV